MTPLPKVVLAAAPLVVAAIVCSRSVPSAGTPLPVYLEKNAGRARVILGGGAVVDAETTSNTMYVGAFTAFADSPSLYVGLYSPHDGGASTGPIAALRGSVPAHGGPQCLTLTVCPSVEASLRADTCTMPGGREVAAERLIVDATFERRSEDVITLKGKTPRFTIDLTLSLFRKM